ncbi:Ldh family oxidoreductase [Oceanidesulfovibrio marinus]|uniref:Ldh family oxidoreductase n=1 Tax=Oceanidesulfovibrio marinus TaxID=370038 RepID=A0A6P1ZEJ5_9BACT|nr:Ldh family oxidoreductase [Oceanidesulfovibrio marinus]QJT10365.1 Ldh family oxidoreductase [Oceanidesulfovibrio marinus]TVM32313.1 Ldh family oxidoreductase [Oceanidesulfovibrio marinus]
MPNQYPRFDAAALRELCAGLARTSSVLPQDADILAASLVDADLHGRSTHGVSRLPVYLQRIDKGLVDPAAQLVLERPRPGVLLADAANGIGQVQSFKTVETLLDMARENGTATAVVRGSQHSGTMAQYCNHAADQGMILFATTDCEPAMAPAGGTEALFGTNPLAASFPTGKGWHIAIDMATSVVARGNIVAANRRGDPIPEGWALDKNGEPTTDAQAALMGTVLTMAGHKGYALALLVELFSGVLSGSSLSADISSMYAGPERPQDVGHFFQALDISAFMDLELFTQRTDALIDRIKGSRRREGVEEILIPGERAARVAARNRAEGVPVDPGVIATLEDMARKRGLEPTISAIT